MRNREVKIFYGGEKARDDRGGSREGTREGKPHEGKLKTEIKVFCTGGLDSSFMLCKLSRRKIVLQPIYVLNLKRKSRERELKAVRKIIAKLRKHPGTKAEIKPLKIVNLETITIDKQIAVARHRLAKQFGKIGWQYDYLTSLTKQIGRVGLGIESNPVDGENLVLKEVMSLKKTRYGYVVDRQKSSGDANIVFGSFLFPILDDTEQFMLEWAEKYGYAEILSLIWFCHKPIKGQACGLCSPCEGKIESGMGQLLPERALERYRKAKKAGFLGEKISHFLKRTIYRVIL